MNAPSCPRCHRTYDELNRIPRILPKCGHTFCQDCLQKMKIYGSIQCPTDSETSKLGASSVTSLTKNMALLDLVKNAPSPGAGGSGGGGAAHLASLSLWVLPEKLELGKKIGEGNFGEVREAVLDDAGHKCKVAVKLLSKSTTSSLSISPGQQSRSAAEKEEEEAFAKEMEVLFFASKHCAFVCQLIGITRKENRLCIIMKKYKHSIQDIMKSQGGKLTASQVLKYGTNICRAMAELHSRGILMRDLKPANFLVDDYDTAVVADFGLSKVLKESKTTTLVRGQVAGTPCYMPPEAWGAGDGKLHQTSDVWSFACSIIDMFTGKPPFDNAGSIFEIQRRVAISKEKPQVPSGLPAEVAEALKKCFAYDAEQRPSFDRLLPIFDRNQMASAQRSPVVPDSSDMPPVQSPRRVSSPPRLDPTPQASSDPSAPPQRFLPKYWVRIKKNVSSPKYGWPTSDKIPPMHECLGILRKVDTEDVVLVRYCFSDEPMIFRMEELEVTSAFREGDTVRVKTSVQRPRFGWGDVTRNVIGTVAAIDSEKATIKVDFPGYSSGWVADPSQMERLSRPFRKGDWARIKASVLRSRRGDSGLQDINESSLAIVKDVLDGGKVKLDFCFKSTYMVMDQCSAELLDTPPFVLNDQVSVKRSVTSPRYEWGGEDHESIGPVAEIRADGLIKVQFYDRGALWAADPAELFVVHPARAFRKGDWTQVKRSVSEPKYKWGDVKPESFGVVADIDEDGDLRVDFCFRPKLWVAQPSDMVLYNPPPFKLGDMVRVKPSVQQPRCNWAGETHRSVGLIANIRQDGLLEIRFSSRTSLWKADPADMVLARGQTQTMGAQDSGGSDASVAAELLLQLLGKERLVDMFKGLHVKGNE